MDPKKTIALQTSYDRVAEEYANRIFDELEHKPFDRQLLEQLAAATRDLGTVCDLGCGPGHVARYLHEHGARVIGVDLSQGMLEQARRLNPELEFVQGDMLKLDVLDESWSGIAAFYSIIHVPRQEVVIALRECLRVLIPGGILLLAFHLGDEILQPEEWWGQPVSLDFIFFQTEEMLGYLKSAGFEIIEAIERPPYPDVEYQSRRVYIFARKPR